MKAKKQAEVVPSVKYSLGKKVYFFIKRLFDIVVSLIGLIVLSPFFLIIILAIRIDSKGPAIFSQERIGLNGKIFKLFKFRSMVLDADEVLFKMLEADTEVSREYKKNKKLKNDPRITKVGAFIRKLSLDELPQLLNILKGDMSLIGNRPYLPREKEDMGSYYEQIIKTKPGLTGFWQVSGRNDISFEARLKLESEYSNKLGLLLDVKIFFKTFIVVFKGI